MCVVLPRFLYQSECEFFGSIRYFASTANSRGDRFPSALWSRFPLSRLRQDSTFGDTLLRIAQDCS